MGVPLQLIMAISSRILLTKNPGRGSKNDG